MRKLSKLALVLALVSACRGGGGDGDDQPGPDGGGNTEDMTIQQIQNDATPACWGTETAGCGVEIKVKGVVVTAIDAFGNRAGRDFWVQEPGGGPFSGIQVYGASLDDIAALQIGDVVDIAGAQKKEYAFDPEAGPLPLEQRMTELEPVEGGVLTVTKTGAQMQIQPEVVDALKIGQMTDYTARNAEWEKWEGVLVKLENVQAFGDQECITSKGMCADMTYQRFDLTGDIVVQSSLAAMPTPNVAYGDCFASVTGVIGYFFDFNIQPRSTAEFGTGGTSCPKESQAAVCADNIDNDGNGFKDCGDSSCILPEAACRPPTTIAAIQTAATPMLGVEIKDAIVAGVSFNKKNLWVQTQLQAGTNEGIYVRGPGADMSTFAVGTRVNIIGRVSEFGDATGTLTTVHGLSITAGTAGTGTVLPLLNQSAATLMSTSGEPLESTLVELKNVRVTTLGTSTNNYIATLTQNGTQFKADDDIYRLASGDLNDCFSSIIGFWSWNGYDGHWVFVPRKATASNAPDGTLAANQNDCN